MQSTACMRHLPTCAQWRSRPKQQHPRPPPELRCHSSLPCCLPEPRPQPIHRPHGLLPHAGRLPNLPRKKSVADVSKRQCRSQSVQDHAAAPACCKRKSGRANGATTSMLLTRRPCQARCALPCYALPRCPCPAVLTASMDSSTSDWLRRRMQTTRHDCCSPTATSASRIAWPTRPTLCPLPPP